MIPLVAYVQIVRAKARSSVFRSKLGMSPLSAMTNSICGRIMSFANIACVAMSTHTEEEVEQPGLDEDDHDFLCARLERRRIQHGPDIASVNP